MKKTWSSVMAVSILAVAAAAAVCLADTPEERAIVTAKEAVKARGIMAGDAQIIYDPSGNRWEEKIAVIESSPSDPNHGYLPRGMLYERKFETVLLDFEEDAKDADTWVFIDKDTGDVITIYQEKR